MIKIAELETTAGKRAGLSYVITDEFRETILDAIEATGETIPQIAKQIGMAVPTMYSILQGRTERMNRKNYKRLMQLSTWNTDKPQEAN